MAMPPDPVAVAAAGIVTPAPGTAPGLVEEHEPAEWVAADPEAVADPDDLEERRQQVADERGPCGSVRRDSGVRIEAEARAGEDREHVPCPAGDGIAEPADHLADRDEA